MRSWGVLGRPSVVSLSRPKTKRLVGLAFFSHIRLRISWLRRVYLLFKSGTPSSLLDSQGDV